MSSRGPSTTAHVADNESIIYTDSVSPPSKGAIVKMLRKPSIYGTIKVMRLFFVEKVHPHHATLTRMMMHFLPIGGIGVERLLPALGLPKKTSAEYMTEKWYDMHVTFNALKGVCSGSGERVLRADQKFVDEILSAILFVLDDAVSSAIAECNEEKMDYARSAMVKLSDAERRRRFLEGGGNIARRSGHAFLCIL